MKKLTGVKLPDIHPHTWATNILDGAVGNSSSVNTIIFFGKGKLYLFQEEYIEVIHRLENFSAFARRAHNL